MQNAYDYAGIVKEDANLIDADGNPAGTLQEQYAGTFECV